ncbi:methyltransferase domain-containing protein [Nocardia sp. 2]|uniref:Methyltransferase domain-containing protein n=1 Tax=Nocardia acididurans TaxID=2802282 RepID=A0ABS1MAS7_9NOCA|nr:methyltransferase domain-containing protein [Nocardia acididurans]MBL1076854.1 methyltransferase domain-containing protein [Nocardia acididurans]
MPHTTHRSSAHATRKLTNLIDRDRAHITGDYDISAGYVNLLGAENRSAGIGQNIMQSTFYPLIYRPWRALGTRLLLGRSVASERALARGLLDLKTGDKVLDVACGPGNFTDWYGDVVGSDGLAVGVDLSPTMLAQAVAGTRSPNAAYLRADALELPFADHTFDSASCFLALFLMPDPMRAVSELARVVRPGGHIAIMAPTAGPGPLGTLARGSNLLRAISGVTLVDRAQLTAAMTRNGLTLTATRHIGMVTYAGAQK